MVPSVKCLPYKQKNLNMIPTAYIRKKKDDEEEKSKAYKN